MTTAQRFEDLDIWQKAKELTNLIYQLSSAGSFAHDYGLRDQMRRAPVSIMSNIAEGFESQTQAIFVQYLARAKAPAGELRAQLYIARDQAYMVDDDFQLAVSLAETCSRKIARLIQYLETQPNARRVRENGAQYDI
jgi:four helix bundle protein